ncbi:MAG: hypothetical protein WA012_11805 [Rhodoferax sp.]|uniref:hypothetical protein n=1 Tax=Rhodoferax sp. TaxID=50421 RepID=UPI003BB172A7
MSNTTPTARPSALLLSTYPFIEPRHGGQLRLAHMAQAFAADGWHVHSLALFEPEGYAAQARGPADVAFAADSTHRLFRGRLVPLVNDLLSGAYAVADDGGWQDILRRLPAQLDVIHVEQPWLWPLAQKIRQLERYRNVGLIYGSQNIEAPLKQDILQSYHVNPADTREVVADIDALEQRAAREADVAVAVTASDLRVLQHWGARRAVLASNGIAPWWAEPEILKHWQARLPLAPWMLYVASAHPPNFTGFSQCVGPALGCLAPDSPLVVAGSVCEPLYQHLEATRWHSLNLSRLKLLYSLADEDLAAVKTLAHAFLLPIPHGGGSNIKTAEALYSGAYVVGTEAAFRGFEDLLDLPEVTVARNPTEFQAAMRNVLARPAATASAYPGGRERRDALRWDRCLASVPAAARAILKGAGPV